MTRRVVWAAVAAAAACGLFYGGWYAGRSFPGPQVPDVFRLAEIRCKSNDGLRRLQQKGFAPKLYDFECNNDARFIDVDTNFEPPTQVATKDVVGQVPTEKVK